MQIADYVLHLYYGEEVGRKAQYGFLETPSHLPFPLHSHSHVVLELLNPHFIRKRCSLFPWISQELGLLPSKTSLFGCQSSRCGVAPSFSLISIQKLCPGGFWHELSRWVVSKKKSRVMEWRWWGFHSIPWENKFSLREIRIPPRHMDHHHIGRNEKEILLANQQQGLQANLIGWTLEN